MRIDWSPLKSELSIWRSEARILPLWWRDDDASKDTPAFQKLLALAQDMTVPVHVAVIPKSTQQSLVDACTESSFVIPIVHGWAHKNHAPDTEKKAEFGFPRDKAVAETAQAFTRLKRLFGDALLPMFVPPWNRIDASLVPHLAQQGYVAISTYGPRKVRTVAPDLVQINTHLDPILWRGGSGLIPPEIQIAALVRTLVDRREGRTDPTEPLGFLTHHLVHDSEIWEFTRTCLTILMEGGAIACDLRSELP
jgi:hypothetical protein